MGIMKRIATERMLKGKSNHPSTVPKWLYKLMLMPWDEEEPEEKGGESEEDQD